jgi:MFS family permease
MTYRWVILVFSILAYATSQFSRQNYSGVQKFIAQDLALDKAALGLLGSTFFYAYALCQMPWGIAADRFGNRWITACGILLTSAAMVGFASGADEGALLAWRAAGGIAAAAVYVSVAGGLARWFPPHERGFSQAALGGIGGALGESTAFFLLPVVSIYFASGWRQATNRTAVVVAAVGVLCLVFLRSDPSPERAAPKSPFTMQMLGDPRLWAYTFLFSAFIVAIRIVQPWISIYAADVYLATGGSGLNAAVIGGGLLTVVAYSLLGRGVGCPLAGKLCDALVKRGIQRPIVAIGWLVLSAILLQRMSTGPTATWAVATMACLLGMSINLFPLITAAVSDTYGPEKTASVVSFVNAVAQIAGATGLALSGYVGMSLNTQAGNSLAEYRGIWLSAMVGVMILLALGAVMYAIAGQNEQLESRTYATAGRSDRP